MKKVGLVGWRGMVGSVLMQRMQEENDFALIEAHFFSTSSAGGAGPKIAGKDTPALKDAKRIDALRAMDVNHSCQGGGSPTDHFPKRRARGGAGHWNAAPQGRG